MSVLFFVLFLLSFILLIAGLIKPKELESLFRKVPSRKMVALIFLSATIIFFIAFSVLITNKEEKPQTKNQANNQEQKSTIKKQ